MKKTCIGSHNHVGVSVGQMFQTAGAVRANKATNVRCPYCKRQFPSARISYTDHGIPTGPQAIIPNHKVAA